MSPKGRRLFRDVHEKGPRGGVRGGDSPLKGGVRGSASCMPHLHALRPEASADFVWLVDTGAGGLGSLGDVPDATLV